MLHHNPGCGIAVFHYVDCFQHTSLPTSWLLLHYSSFFPRIMVLGIDCNPTASASSLHCCFVLHQVPLQICSGLTMQCMNTCNPCTHTPLHFQLQSDILDSHQSSVWGSMFHVTRTLPSPPSSCMSRMRFLARIVSVHTLVRPEGTCKSTWWNTKQQWKEDTGLQFLPGTTIICRFGVLEQEPRYWKRCVLEAIHIMKHDNSTNSIWTP